MARGASTTKKATKKTSERGAKRDTRAHRAVAKLSRELGLLLLRDVEGQVHRELLLALRARLRVDEWIAFDPLQALLLGSDRGVDVHPAAAGALVALVALGLRVAVVARRAVEVKARVAVCGQGKAARAVSALLHSAQPAGARPIAALPAPAC